MGIGKKGFGVCFRHLREHKEITEDQELLAKLEKIHNPEGPTHESPPARLLEGSLAGQPDHSLSGGLPPGWNEAMAENGKMFYYKHDPKTCWKLYRGRFVPPPPTFRPAGAVSPMGVPPPPPPTLRKPSPPGPDKYPESSTWTRPTEKTWVCLGTVTSIPFGQNEYCWANNRQSRTACCVCSVEKTWILS